jgi:anthranilate phosphoribosyltransferase
LGAERVMVVHGHPGMDEVSASGPTMVAEFVDGAVRTYTIDPETVGIALVSPRAVGGGDATDNAKILRDVLEGVHGAPRDTTLINAAAGLLVAGRVSDLAEGVAVARASIDEGRALAVLEALVTLTDRLGAEADAAKAVRP